MPEEPLYQDEQITIDYLPNSTDDHELLLKEKSGENAHYLIPRGILSELATTPRGSIETKIATFNDLILFAIEKEGIKVDGLHVALCQAYLEQEKRYQDSRN